MQDEPTPEELIKAVADFLRSDIAPGISGHNAFKLRVSINALDLVSRQLTLEQDSDAAEVSRLSQLLGVQGSLTELNRTLADRIAKGKLDLQTPGLVEHLWQTTMDKGLQQSRHPEEPRSCAASRRMSRRAGCCHIATLPGSPKRARTSGRRRRITSLPHPFRRALFGKRLRPLDIILRRRHRLDGRIVALL